MNVLGFQQIKRKLQRIIPFYVLIILLSETSIIHKVKILKYFITEKKINKKFLNWSNFGYFWKNLRKILFLYGFFFDPPIFSVR